MSSLHNSNQYAAMMEPQVSVARIAVDAHHDYKLSKQKEGDQAAEAVRHSLMPPNNKTRGVPSTTSSAEPMSGMVLHGRKDGYEAAKRESAASTAPAVSTDHRNEPTSAGMARVDRHDDYQNAKLVSAVALDTQFKATLRSSAKAPLRTMASMDGSTELFAMPPLRAMASMDDCRSSSVTDNPTSSEPPITSVRRSHRRTASGNELASRLPNRSSSLQADTTTRNSNIPAGQSVSLSQPDRDARVKAGLRNSRASGTVVGAIPMMNDNSTSQVPSTRWTQIESDARVKAGLRNARAAPVVGAVPMMNDNSAAQEQTGLRNSQVSRAAPGVGAVPMMNDNSNPEAPFATKLTKVESDARVKAGLRNARPSVVGATAMMNDNNSPEAPTRLTQAESDARVKAGLRNGRAPVVIGAASMTNDDNSIVAVHPQLTQSELDARVKAGLRNARSPVVGAVAKINDNSSSEASTRLTQSESDARVKAGLRNPLAGASEAAMPTRSTHVESDPRVRAGLRNSRAAPVVGTAQMMNDTSSAELTTSSIAMLDQHRRGLEASEDLWLEEGDGIGNRTDEFDTDDYEGMAPTDHMFGGDNPMQDLVGQNVSGTLPACYDEQVPHGNTRTAPNCVQVVQPTDKILEKEAGNGSKHRLWYIILMVVVVVIIVVVVAVTTSKASGNGSQATTGPPEESESIESPLSTLAAVFPTTVLPDDTVEAIESKSVKLPQVQAYNWLLEDPNLSEYSEAKRLQRFALATFYYATNGQGWLPEGTENSWVRYDVHECSWFSSAQQQGRTTCRGFDSNTNVTSPFDHYEYVSLMLSGELPNLYKRVKGTLPLEMSLLSSLEILDLGLQQLRGSIPDLGTLSSTLRDIVLYDNALTGSVPSSLYTFPENFWLSKNKFSESTIPTSVGLNSNLRTLFMIDCKLTGSIPSEIFQSKPNLQLLWLDQNSLDGPIPSEIGLATALQNFRIVENKVSGRIPTELGVLSKMTVLWLHLNEITGSLVTEMGKLVELQVSGLP
jgi:Leucine-rich repeat (LRR) protein